MNIFYKVCIYFYLFIINIIAFSFLIIKLNYGKKSQYFINVRNISIIIINLILVFRLFFHYLTKHFLSIHSISKNNKKYMIILINLKQ